MGYGSNADGHRSSKSARQQPIAKLTKPNEGPTDRAAQDNIQHHTRTKDGPGPPCEDDQIPQLTVPVRR